MMRGIRCASARFAWLRIRAASAPDFQSTIPVASFACQLRPGWDLAEARRRRLAKASKNRARQHCRRPPLACLDQIDLQPWAQFRGRRRIAPIRDAVKLVSRIETDFTGLTRRWVRMKKLAGVLGILALGGIVAAGCSYQSQIDQATSQAEASAQSASTAATNAQNSANQAAQSAKTAEQSAAGSEDSVKRANDAVARLEAAFASSVTK